MTTNQTERVSDEELDQMILKLERDGMTPKMLSLMKELREVRRAKGEPVAWTWQHLDQWHVTNNEERARDLAWDGVKVIPLYTAPPAPVAPDMFMPKNLDRALGVVGVALPESKEEFNFQIERWTQRLIDRVIRYADEFRESPALVVPTNVADAIERLKQRLADCHRFNYCAEAVREVEDASRLVMLQAGNSRGIPDEQSFWNWLREEMPTTYRWSRELEDTPENSALITKGKASALDMLSAWKGCSATMLNHSGDTADMDEPVSNRDELPATQFKPVADLYGITSPTGSETSFTFDAIEAANFIEGGWSAQEYVELERYQEAMIGNLRENVNSSTNNCREITETSTNCHKCGGRGTYHCPQMLGTVECECTLSAAPKEVQGE